MIFKLEVIGFTLQGCIAAQNAGAHRIELCDNPEEGGTTPSYGFIKIARKNLTIDLYPIIRPRGGDFLYTTAEFEMMIADIKICKELGCDGVALGMLNADGSIDKVRCSQLVQLAYPLSVTFHRAFDRVPDTAQALEDIIEMGCERILTSGGLPHALDGAAAIASFIQQAKGRIIIMPGSGIRSDNISLIANQTGATEFHSSARVFSKSMMEYNKEALKENLQFVTADEEEVIKMVGLMQKMAGNNI